MAGLMRRHQSKVVLIGDMVSSILVFPFVLTYMEKWYSSLEDPTKLESGSVNPTFWICALYGVMALAHLFRAIRLREKSRSAFIAHLAYGVAFAACAMLAAVLSATDRVCQILAFVFWAVLIAERAFSVARNRRPWSIAFNAVLVLLFLLLAFASAQLFPMLFTVVGAIIYSFISIMIVAFSRIRLNVLKDIIRKTYASEIISCLLLLMIAFSFALKFMDESIETFWDGLWYCFAVVTTIGFGDITPTQPISRVLSVILGVYGIVVVALITSIIVNFYGEMKKADAAPGIGGGSDSDAGEDGQPRE